MSYEKFFKILGGNLRTTELILILNNTKPLIRISVFDSEKTKVTNLIDELDLAYSFSDFKIVQKNDVGKGGFSNFGFKIKSESKTPGHYHMYISKSEKLVIEAKFFEKKNDNIALGELLGYPKCCIDFYEDNRQLQEKKQNDYVIPAFKQTKSNILPYQNNICARYFDYSILSHFPCSFDCQESLKLGKKYEEKLKNYEQYKGLKIILKSLVIYTEYDGVFLVVDYTKKGNTINYDRVHYTIKNNIYEIIKNSNQLEILSRNKIKIKNNIIENINAILFG